MSRNYHRCPFSKTGCRECSIYRGRHSCIRSPEGKAPRSIVTVKDGEWKNGFKSFFESEDERDFKDNIKSYP
ncbi:MAG: hypothetical protein GXY80_02855 [Syntrophorhabdus aromaticivorans]|uniref:Uncharacterized protein n=1 Tax=Syntrophorhabdus aromaticivorans TaxID=328301 RepID=A0A971M2F8_9BACT|nr:hypothetical protein [Syntrophorhabdus aromaticivorans]OPY73370.1 MAG: hypothetical protein A4E63_00989 [Syntrophorhabdus sp. PtaU1.Bin050]